LSDLKKYKAHQWALDVVNGEEMACSYIILACQRYFNDLENAQAKGIEFSIDSALHVIEFFQLFIKHSKGDFAGLDFILEPWQEFQLWNLFGMLRRDVHGVRRRFRTSYTEIPRKNGKTTLAAGISLYTAFADGEMVAENYFAATKKDQARIGFDEAQRMVKQSPALKRHMKVQSNSIFDKKTQSKIMPLSSDVNSLDALNIHCGIIDELHAHKTDEIVNVLRTSTGSRKQPLIYEITTAGQNEQSVCYDHRQYTIDVLNQKLEDDSWFGMIFTLDDGDDWKDPAVWKKANPNLGVSKKAYYMEEQVKEAINRETYQNTVKRLDFNIWGGVTARWLPENIWIKRKAKISQEDLLAHFECTAGLDIASTRDFNSLGLCWWNETDYHLSARVWCPKAMVDDRVKRQNVGFETWVNKGWIKAVPGNIMDSTTIGQDVITYCIDYAVISMAYDRALGYSGLIQSVVAAGIETHPQSQAITDMSEPSKMLEKMLVGDLAGTDGSPVLDWMLGNVHLYTDPNGNIKLNKGKSQDKIDGPVSIVMAIAEMMFLRYGSDDYDPLNDNAEFF
jgi:phage terminase large subunit-like protein